MFRYSEAMFWPLQTVVVSDWYIALHGHVVSNDHMLGVCHIAVVKPYCVRYECIPDACVIIIIIIYPVCLSVI